MKLLHRAIRSGDYLNGIECFFLTGNPKNPRQRVSFFDLKLHGPAVESRKCRCGGSVLDLIRNHWTVCQKCGADYSQKGNR